MLLLGFAFLHPKVTGPWGGERLISDHLKRSPVDVPSRCLLILTLGWPLGFSDSGRWLCWPVGVAPLGTGTAPT